jgi:hypothetical protein
MSKRKKIFFVKHPQMSSREELVTPRRTVGVKFVEINSDDPPWEITVPLAAIDGEFDFGEEWTDAEIIANRERARLFADRAMARPEFGAYRAAYFTRLAARGHGFHKMNNLKGTCDERIWELEATS